MPRLVSIGRPAAQANVPGVGWRLGYSRRFWLLLVPVAVLSGAIGAGLKVMLRLVEHAAWGYRAGEMSDAVGAVSDLHRLASLTVAGALAGGISWGMTKAAGTTGGGMNGAIWSREGRMATLPSLISAGLSIVIIAMGASIGREQPPKEASAAVASWASLRAGLTTEERCLLMACAAGGGWAAVYNIPFAGGVFAAEVLVGTLALPVVVAALATSVLAFAVTWPIISVHPYYAGIPTYPVSTSLLVWAVLAGPVLGAAGMGFVWLLGFANRHRVHGNGVLVGPLAAFTVLAVLSFAYPGLLGNGRDLGENVFLGGLATLTILALAVLKPLLTALCWGSGASGGMFTPTTSFGALLGALLAHAWVLAWPGEPIGAFALVGATGLLAAAMAAPVSAILLMVELTHQLSPLLVPVLLAAAGASLTARWLGGGSIYSVRLPLSEPPESWAGSGTWSGTSASGPVLPGVAAGEAAAAPAEPDRP